MGSIFSPGVDSSPAPQIAPTPGPQSASDSDAKALAKQQRELARLRKGRQALLIDPSVGGIGGSSGIGGTS